jgi:hypothetical protein
MIRRIGYYLCSIPTILGQIRNWYVCFGLLLNKKNSGYQVKEWLSIQSTEFDGCLDN